MDFDERLHHAFDTLAERLRKDISAQLNSTSLELSGAARSERDEVVDQVRREARTAAAREANEQVAARIAHVEANVRAEASAAQRKTGDRLIEAVRAMDGASSLSGVLDVLVTSAAVEVGRAAIFLPQGSTLRGWRLVGFEGLGPDQPAIELPFGEGGMIAEAGETGRLVRVDPGSPRTHVPSFVDLSEQSRALAVPLVMTGQVFAVLYVDESSSTSPNHEAWPATIEVLGRHAARSLEAITASRLAQVGEETT